MQIGIIFFFFNDTATTEIYTLSLHDALPISLPRGQAASDPGRRRRRWRRCQGDRKSTRLNSSHSQISYAVFCLKKKKTDSVRDDRHATHVALTPPTQQRPPHALQCHLAHRSP